MVRVTHRTAQTTHSERALNRVKIRVEQRCVRRSLTAIGNLGVSGMGCRVRPQKELGVSTGCCLNQRQPVCLALKHGEAVHVRTNASLCQTNEHQVSECETNLVQHTQRETIAAHLWATTGGDKARRIDKALTVSTE